MKKSVVFIFCFLFAIRMFSQSSQNFDIQGHRGCRGLMPENTIPAFIKALELGVNTLELDVVVSKDNQLVVSHDPWFLSDITLDKAGKPIPKASEKQYNLYKMDYAEIRQYDCGSKGNSRFPQQQKMKVAKPLLKEVFLQTQNYILEHKLKSVKYNIETKCSPDGDDIFHPKPEVFAKLLYDEIMANKMQDFVIIQSFDIRTLQVFQTFPVKLPLVLLVENKDSIEKNIEKLGFQPDVYSPYFKLIDKNMISYCKAKGIKLIPWTVNETEDMEAIKKLNIDGLITDYPDRAIKVFRK
jgi:glycerophosphoryl diester phosphodiesterase